MKIKINVVNDNEETSIKDNDLTEYRNSIKPGSGKHPSSFKKPLTIGNPVHTGDVLLIKAKDKLFKCEIIDYNYFNESPNLFSVKIYPLDKDDKLAVENDDITHNVLKENYLYGIITFDTEIKRDENRNRYWEIDFTKGEIQTSSTIDEFKDFSMRSQPFTVVKFLTRSVPASTVQDNDLTEYRNSIKPDDIKHPYFFKETRAVGNPVKAGDTLLIKAKDKLFKCEIEDSKVFSKTPNMFSVKVYPLDKDDKAALENNEYARKVLKENYLDGIINFDMEIQDENGDTYWEIDFTKGRIKFSLSIVDNFKDFIK